MASESRLLPRLATAPVLQVLKAEPLTSVQVIATADERYVRKVYRQPRWLLWRTFLMPSRAAREWSNLDQVKRAGVPCIEALAWDEERKFGCVRSSALVTRFVAGAPSLKQVLATPQPAGRRRELTAAFGALVGRLHDAGFLGARITPRNILVVDDAGATRLVLLDLPAAIAFRASLVGTGRADLDLWDAALSPGRRRQLSRCERLRVLRGYHQGDRVVARATWRRLVARPRWSNQVRKAAWVALYNYLRVAWGKTTGSIHRLVPMRDFPRGGG